MGELRRAGALTGDRPITAGRSRRPRRRVLLMVPLAAAVAAAAVAAGVVSRRPTVDPLSVGCYDQLSQQASTTVLGPDSFPPGMTPVQACRAAWASFTDGQSAPADLVVCVVDGGGTGVFPNRDGMSAEEACGSIGAALPSDGPVYAGASADQVRWMHADLRRRLAEAGAESCGPAAVVHRAAQAALDAQGLRRWRVDDQAAGEVQAGYRIDASAGEVIIQPGYC